MAEFKELYDAIISGNAPKAEEITTLALEQGTEPAALLNDYMIPAMDEVGQRFERNEFFVPGTVDRGSSDAEVDGNPQAEAH